MSHAMPDAKIGAPDVCAGGVALAGAAQPAIRAGTLDEILEPAGADWIFIDVGFSGSKRSNGWLRFGAGESWRGEAPSGKNLRHDQLRGLVRDEVKGPALTPLNIVIEAPLSFALDGRGNPCPRNAERSPRAADACEEGASARRWYAQTGPATLLAAQFLLLELKRSERLREVRLFEGFVSVTAG